MEIARILFAGSDVLLLDEPTNHLDIDAKEWLLDFMRAYRGALLVISHDLDLLDEAITRVLHLDRAGTTTPARMDEYKGTYTQYLEARAKDEVRLAKMAAAQAKEIDRLQRLVDRFGAKATKASMAHSIEKRIVRLEADAVGRARAAAHHARDAFPTRPKSARTVLEVEGLAKSLRRPRGVRRRHFDAGRGERLLVLGLNGAGKTSLLRVLAGETEPDEGSFTSGTTCSPATTPRSTRGSPPAGRMLEHVREPSPDSSDETDLRASSAMFGLTGDKVFQDAGDAVRRGEDEAGPRPARGRSPQPAAARRAHQQPGPGVPRGDGRGAGAGPARWCWSATTPSSSRRSSPTGCC